MTLARMRAKKSVLLELRAQGLKPQHFSSREIAMLTDYYLNQLWAQLMAEACGGDCYVAGICSLALAATQKQPISTTSAVQILGAK
jgi:hypothetical protein